VNSRLDVPHVISCLAAEIPPASNCCGVLTQPPDRARLMARPARAPALPWAMLLGLSDLFT